MTTSSPRAFTEDTVSECDEFDASHSEVGRRTSTVFLDMVSFSGRAYLFDQCVNITFGKIEDRILITGLHSVCDIFCKRCKTMVGWTYARAYEASQKYKEKKFIIEKINLHMEDSPCYGILPAPAGERPDRWRRRSMKWGTEERLGISQNSHDSGVKDVVFEYLPSKVKGKTETN